ncbi:MAG TPA: GGDEF domain-containing protein, partial [Bacillales bacterium]|nr:GGDEF domain-containing protein [Bacillales bacterium]
MRYTGRISALVFAMMSEAVWFCYIYWQYHFYPKGYSLAINIALVAAYCMLGWWVGKNYDKARFYSQKDGLTDTFNRGYFMKKASRALVQADQTGRQAALIFLDLDRFKIINDSWGHLSGDLIIKEVSDRIRSILGSKDLFARSAGDEFIILLNATDQVRTEETVQEMIDRISEPLKIKGQSLHVSACFGISFYPKDGNSLEALIKYAD